MAIDSERLRINQVVSAIQADINVDIMEKSISVQLDLNSIAINTLNAVSKKPCTVNIYAGEHKITMEPTYKTKESVRFTGMKRKENE